MKTITKTIYANAHIPSLIIGTGAVTGGLTAAVIRGGVAVFPAIMTFIFMWLMQISANLYHGYVDRCFGAGENISGMRDRSSRSDNHSVVALMKIVANGFGLLALTAGLSLFAYVGWVGVAYFAVILVLLYFYFAGPRPVVRTKWSIIFTFILFGPIAVSGTALVQDSITNIGLPIVVYSVINGLLAANAHIAIQYLRFEEDRTNGNETLVTEKGGFFTRFVYLGNAVLVSLILMVRPTAISYVSSWVGVVVAICYLASAVWVFTKMHRNPTTVSSIVRNITLFQYIAIVVVLLIIVACSIDNYHIDVLDMM